MHKGFPSSTILTSDIMWNNAQPNFNYTCQMPFTLNQTTAEMLDNNLFIVELWNKPDNDGASACKAQAMFIHKYGKEKFFYVHDKLHEVHDFKKTQEILGTDAEEGLKILERYL